VRTRDATACALRGVEGQGRGAVAPVTVVADGVTTVRWPGAGGGDSEGDGSGVRILRSDADGRRAGIPLVTLTLAAESVKEPLPVPRRRSSSGGAGPGSHQIIEVDGAETVASSYPGPAAYCAAPEDEQNEPPAVHWLPPLVMS